MYQAITDKNTDTLPQEIVGIKRNLAMIRWKFLTVLIKSCSHKEVFLSTVCRSSGTAGRDVWCKSDETGRLRAIRLHNTIIEIKKQRQVDGYRRH